MTAATLTRTQVKRAVTKAAKKPKYWRCQFCVGGHHGSCPGAVWHRQVIRDGKGNVTGVEPVLWRCLCEEPGHPTFPYCTRCKNDSADGVNPTTWLCVDRHGCETRLEARRKNSDLWQMLQRCRSVAANKKRAARLGAAAAAAAVDPDQDARIEQLLDYQAQLARNKRKKNSGPRKTPPKPSTGRCECCGETTRGGRFLPGHDAKLASRLRAQVAEGSAEAYEELKQRGWLNKLPGKLRGGPVAAASAVA